MNVMIIIHDENKYNVFILKNVITKQKYLYKYTLLPQLKAICLQTYQSNVTLAFILFSNVY